MEAIKYNEKIACFVGIKTIFPTVLIFRSGMKLKMPQLLAIFLRYLISISQIFAAIFGWMACDKCCNDTLSYAILKGVIKEEKPEEKKGKKKRIAMTDSQVCYGSRKI